MNARRDPNSVYRNHHRAWYLQNQRRYNPSRKERLLKSLVSLLTISGFLSAPFVILHLLDVKAQRQSEQRRQAQARSITLRDFVELARRRLETMDERFGPFDQYRIVELGNVVLAVSPNSTVKFSHPEDAGIWSWWQSGQNNVSNRHVEYNWNLLRDLGIGVVMEINETGSGNEDDRKCEILIFMGAPNSFTDRGGIAELLRVQVNSIQKKHDEGEVTYLQGTGIAIILPSNGTNDLNDTTVVRVGQVETNPSFDYRDENVCLGIKVDDSWASGDVGNKR